MSRWPSSEVELGRAVTAFLQGEEWELYPEVAVRAYDSIFDLVAHRPPVFMVVELKRVLSFAVVEQAMRAREYAHCIAIGVPSVHRRPGRAAVWSLLRSEGIGLIEATPSYCEMVLAPTILRKPPRLPALQAVVSDPLQSTVEPGSNRGGHMTAFRRTCSRLARHVIENPGCFMRDALSAIEHHYINDASASGALSSWIRSDRVDGVRVEREGRRIRLYPATEPPDA